jgi:hypothetical protein
MTKDSTSGQPNYYAYDIPQHKPPEDYTYLERRAEILHYILQCCSPYVVHQSRLADRYDVTDGQISQDMDRLRKHVAEQLGDEVKFTTRIVFVKTVRELQAQDKWKQAWDVVLDWNEWLADIGEQHREPTHVTRNTAIDDGTSTDSYSIIIDSGTTETLDEG